MEPTDAELISRVLASDDRHAFDTLVRRYQSAVRAFLRRLSGGRNAEADDLAQEAFVTVYRQLDRYRGEARFSSWLFGIAYNCWRTERRRHRIVERWTDDLPEAQVRAENVSGDPTPTQQLDLRQDLAAALAQLSADEQVAIHLCYQEGLTHEEAAAVLGTPLGTVKTHVLRAKQKLRTHLQAWAPSHP